MTGGADGAGGAGGLDWRAVAEGALLALAVTLPPVILVRILHGDDPGGQESNLWFVPVLAVFAGFALGGHRAARKRPRTGLTHAATAAGVAFGGLALYSIARHLVTGEEVSVSYIIRLMLVGSITVSIGVLGGYVAVRRSERTGGAA